MSAQLRQQLIELICSPGRKPEVRGVATTHVLRGDTKLPDEEEQIEIGFVSPIKHRKLDRWLDHVVDFAGSTFAFLCITGAVLVWSLLGVKFGHNVNWQVIISDVQALLCYIYDSLLTRHLLNAYEDDLAVVTQLQSRCQSHLRMLRALKGNVPNNQVAEISESVLDSAIIEEHMQKELPAETWFERCVTFIANTLGHITALILFWVGILVWIGIGPLFDFANSWQLYMNSATSALMLFTFGLLAHLGQRHADDTKKALNLLFETDSKLELQLRLLTHDTAPNSMVTLAAPKVSKVQRAIFYYADFVGTLVGIAILAIVLVIWIAIGPALHYNSDWWLLIGTYAGLVGMFDGFVLRNMQACLDSYMEQGLRAVHEQDEEMLAAAGVSLPAISATKNRSMATRLFQLIDHTTSGEWAVIAAMLTMFGLLAGSSAMRWSLTGQLLSNVPPSIIESWLMMVLVSGHVSIEGARRSEFSLLYARRSKMLAWLATQGAGISEKA